MLCYHFHTIMMVDVYFLLYVCDSSLPVFKDTLIFILPIKTYVAFSVVQMHEKGKKLFFPAKIPIDYLQVK